MTPCVRTGCVLCLGAIAGIAGFAGADTIGQPTINVFFSPHGGYEKDATKCVDEVVQQLKDARATVFVRAYGFTSEPIRDALIAARERGLSVGIICDRSERKNPHSIAPACIKAGCNVTFDDNHPISHSKVLVIDGMTSIVGSYNWTANAEKNAETMLVIRDRVTARKLLDDWKHHKEHSTAAKDKDLSYWENLGHPEKLGEAYVQP